MRITKITSGGQTGVDRAALDAAIAANIPHGGWCPKGRIAEDGAISDRYLLHETKTSNPAERTKLNIRDSDGTLILVLKLPVDVTDGTILTIEEVKIQNKPNLLINLSDANEVLVDQILFWINNNITILNIAGPRESQANGIYDKALAFLLSTFHKTNSSAINHSYHSITN